MIGAAVLLLMSASPVLGTTPSFSMSGTPTAPDSGALNGGLVGTFRTSVAQWFEVRWTVRSYIAREHCYGMVIVTDSAATDAIRADMRWCSGAVSTRADVFLHPGLHKVQVYSYVGWTVTVTREPTP